MEKITFRLNNDINTQTSLQPLFNISISVTIESVKLCQSLIAPDVPVRTFVNEYFRAADLLEAQSNGEEELNTNQSYNHVCGNTFPTIKLALVRAIAAKPHSADVERLISI